jgi:hypothetical protein
MNDCLSPGPPGIHTGLNIYQGLGAVRPLLPDRRLPEQTRMQQRETGKNYIGLLSEEFEEPRATEVRLAIDRPMKACVLRLMAAMFSRRSEAR